ncbi:phosphoribosyltransferase [Patescibacteria group bacterium]|nr:phosphoribosyltransferase [Patescibacteria group bacterium]
MKSILLKDRADGGKKLSQELLKYKKDNLIILALPRGGVPIGYEIAKKLRLNLNVIVSQKLGSPENPELGIGAISENSTQVLDTHLITTLNVSKNELSNVIIKEKKELERRVCLYRNSEPLPDLTNKTILLVDDGLATGVTAEAAIKSLKKLKPKKIIFAAPVCALDTTGRLKKTIDELICITTPHNFFSVGSWYKHFPQATDQDVIRLLKKANKYS